MLCYEGIMHQSLKDKQIVCGDYIKTTRLKNSYYFGVFDGIGSGIYANITAIECGERWAGMVEKGLSFSETCEKLAAGMHKARTEDFPFTAFSCAAMTANGKGTIYTYEAPKPVLIRNGLVRILEPKYYTTGYEIIGESKAQFEPGDLLLLFSDGVSQAGLGNGYTLGWGEKGVAQYCRGQLDDSGPKTFLKALAEKCKRISGNKHYDDTSLLLIHCDQAKHLSVFTGPPGKKELDPKFAEDFQQAPGKKLVCGSTTVDILARELDLEVKLKEKGLGFNSPPEYTMPGAEMVTEGAMVLNQVSNILDADEIEITDMSSPERLTTQMLEADVIHFHVGDAENKAHKLLTFRQLGIKERRIILEEIEDKLKRKGKMIEWEHY